MTTHPTPRARRLWTTLALLALASITACGGGGSTSTSPNPTPDPGPSPRSVSFDSAGSFLLPQTASLGLQDSDADSFTLALTAVQVIDLYGYGVDLSYDPEIVEFTGFTEGPFLATDGADVVTRIAENPPGNLVIGQSRLGDVDAVDGTGRLLLLDFAIRDRGSMRMEFSGPFASNDDGDDVELQFIGGTLTITGGS